jgi:hypothetical protein
VGEWLNPEGLDQLPLTDWERRMRSVLTRSRFPKVNID